ncbi:hypothetical protein HKD37_15G043433 [Glycine soja]
MDEIMGSPPASTPPPPPPPPPSDASASPSVVKRTCKASRLRSLSTRPPGAERPVVHVDPATGKADGPHRKKLRTYLGIVVRDKVDITYENWKEVPTAQDVLAATIGRPEHPGRVRAAGVDIRDQLEESIAEKVTRQVMASISQLQSQMQSQGLAVPLEPLVVPSDPRVSTKGSCVDPSGNDPETGDSDRCGLYIEADLARLVAMGRVYEGSTVVHNTPLLPGQVNVSVEEVTDADAPVPLPTDEVSLVGQALHTFLAWPTHLVVVSPTKPPPKPDLEVDDPLYLMTLTIPELFLRPYQVRWDATVFGVFNPDFPLYIKHEDLSKIARGGQCLNISVLQLWIMHLTETCMQVGNSDIYGFLEPQSIQRFHCSGHWQMVVILPKEHLVVWFCSLHNRPDNYLKGIINSAIKGLDDAPQPKAKASARRIVVKCNKQKGSTECGYYVMHWMSTIILGTFRNNWEAYFNDPRPLEPERLKTLQIQWA